MVIKRAIPSHEERLSDSPFIHYLAFVAIRVGRGTSRACTWSAIHRICGLKKLDLYISIWQYSRMAIRNTGDSLSLTFGALADPTRRAILARLALGEADVSQLMKPFGLSQPTISKHLTVLERAGLVRHGRDAQRRPRTLV